MTRIVSFKIEGLAGRPGTVSHSLNPDTNVFYGSNGCGKTSMLRILHSALENSTRGLNRVPFTKAQVTFESKNHGAQYTRTLSKSELSTPEKTSEYWDEESETIVRVESGRRSRSEWRTTPKNAERDNSVPFTHRWLPITRVSESRRGGLARRNSRKAGVSEITDADFDQVFSDGIMESWHHIRYRTTLDVNDAQDRGLMEILEVAVTGSGGKSQYADRLDARSAFEMVNEFFSEERQRVSGFSFSDFDKFQSLYDNDNSILQHVVQKLQSVESSIANAIAPQLRLEELIQELFSNGTEIDFSGESIVARAHGNRMPLGQLSSGQRQLLLILLECMRAGDNTILIDEPELSMHVDWQQRLIHSMNTVNPNAQLVMATHSPEVLADIDDRCVIEL